jgi:hypothetical protein
MTSRSGVSPKVSRNRWAGCPGSRDTPADARWSIVNASRYPEPSRPKPKLKLRKPMHLSQNGVGSVRGLGRMLGRVLGHASVLTRPAASCPSRVAGWPFCPGWLRSAAGSARGQFSTGTRSKEPHTEHLALSMVLPMTSRPRNVWAWQRRHSQRVVRRIDRAGFAGSAAAERLAVERSLMVCVTLTTALRAPIDR